MQQPVCILATIQPKAQHLAEAREAILDIVPQTLAEPGCRTFRLLDGEDGQLRLYEEWDSQAALDEHYAQSYTQEVFAAYESWLAEPVTILNLQRLA